jgi:hypothetical protein
LTTLQLQFQIEILQYSGLLTKWALESSPLVGEVGQQLIS